MTFCLPISFSRNLSFTFSIGRAADEYLAGLGDGFKPLRHVHRVAKDGIVHPPGRTDVARDDHPGVYPYPYVNFSFALLAPSGLPVHVCILIAARTARSASSGFVKGAPKRAIIASPMYLSSVPPYSNTISVIFVKYSFRNSAT